MNKAKNGFTLIELLVVIGIIVLLYAALFPSYMKYKRRMVVLNATLKIYGDINEAVSEVNSKKLTADFVFYPNGVYSITYSSAANLDQKKLKKALADKAKNMACANSIIGAACAGPAPLPSPAAAPSLPPVPQKTQYINPASSEPGGDAGAISIQLPGGANTLEIQPYSKDISGRWVRNVIIFKNDSSEAARSGDIIVTDGENQGVIRATLSGKIELVK